MDSQFYTVTKLMAERIFIKLITYSILVLVLALFGCSKASSVRNSINDKANYRALAKEQDAKDKNEVDKKKDKDIDQEEYNNLLTEIKSTPKKSIDIADNSKEAKTDLTDKKKLPTLRDQLNQITSEQDGIKTDINGVKRDVVSIKSSIEDIKDALRNMNNANSKKTFTGGEKLQENENKIPVNKSNNLASNKILSNEQEESNKNKFVETKVKSDESQDKAKQQIKKHTVKTTKPKSEPEITEEPAVNKKSKSKKPKLKDLSEQPETAGDESAHKMTSEDYKHAMASISKKDYQEAITLLQDIVKNEKDIYKKSDCNYWLGESSFGLKQYQQSIDFFKKVVNSIKTSKSDDAQIMLAEAQIRSGQVKEAKNSFQNLIAKFPESEFIPRARKMIQQL